MLSPSTLARAIVGLLCILLLGCKDLKTVEIESHQDQSTNWKPAGLRANEDPPHFFGFTQATAETSIKKAFQAILWRNVDTVGLRTYSDILLREGLNGWRLVLRDIANSDEFYRKIEPSKSYDQILARFYEHFLGPGRNVDPQGRSFFMPMLLKGKYGEVIELIATSHEYFSKLFVFPQLNLARAQEASRRAFKAILWRPADLGGLNNYSEIILNHGYSGWVATVRALVESDEFKSVREKKSSKEILERLFEHFLGPNRPVDETGYSAFMPMLANGHYADVAVYIATSDEFMGKISEWNGDVPPPPPKQLVTPYQVIYRKPTGGWYPVISGEGRFVAFGTGESKIYDLESKTERNVGLTQIYSNAWIRPGVLTFFKSITDDTAHRYEYSAIDGRLTLMSDHADLVPGNTFLADENHWISILGSKRRITVDNRLMVSNIFGIVGIGRDDFVSTDNENSIIRKYDFNARVLASFVPLIPIHQLSYRNKIILYGGYGSIRAIHPDGRDVDLSVSPWNFEGLGKAIKVDGEDWVITTTWNERLKKGYLLLRPFGQKECIIIDLASVSVDILYSSGIFIIATNDDQGVLTVLRVSKSAHRHPLLNLGTVQK